MADDYDWVQVTTTAPDYVDVILSSLPRIGEAPLTVAFNADSWHTQMRPVDCVLDYGDGSAPELFHMDPPYLNNHFSYTYNVAGSFQASLHCFDSEGVSAYTTGEINVSMHPGNRDPEINVFSPSTVSGLAPLDVDFDLAASDPDGDLVACDVSFGDGSSLSDISFGSPDYDSSTVSHRYTVHADEPYTVEFSCIDRRGGAANWSTEVAVAKGANKEPSVRLGAAPPHGLAPLNVALTLAAADADLEPLSCELDLGQGNGSVPLTLTPPYRLTVFHLFSEPGAYVATLDCNDGTASAASLPLLIHVTAPEKRSLPPLSPLPAMDGGTLLGAVPEGETESKRDGDDP